MFGSVRGNYLPQAVQVLQVGVSSTAHKRMKPPFGGVSVQLKPPDVMWAGHVAERSGMGRREVGSDYSLEDHHSSATYLVYSL